MMRIKGEKGEIFITISTIKSIFKKRQFGRQSRGSLAVQGKRRGVKLRGQEDKKRFETCCGE